jgi:hypothetical protein
MSKHLVIFINGTTGQPELITEVADSASELALQQFKDAVRLNATEIPAGHSCNSRGVIVTEVDPDVLDQWVNPKVTPRNGLRATPLDQFHQFPSALQASQHLGLKNNEVALGLGKAAREGRQDYVVRGVTFQYIDVFTSNMHD